MRITKKILEEIGNAFDVGEVVQFGKFISQDWDLNLEEYDITLLEKQLYEGKEIVFLCSIDSTGTGEFYIPSFISIKTVDDAVEAFYYSQVANEGFNKENYKRIESDGTIRSPGEYPYTGEYRVEAPEDFDQYEGNNSLWAQGVHSGGFNLESLCD